MVQWLGLGAFTAMAPASIPGWGTNILQASRLSNKTKQINKQKTQPHWASLVVQWLRIHLLMQGTRVQALVGEDRTCRRPAKPVRHNY